MERWLFTRRRFALLAPMTVVLLVSGAVIYAESIAPRAAADDEHPLSTPTPAPVPETQPTRPAVGPSDALTLPMLIGAEGRVIRFRLQQETFSQASTDPQNGQRILGDIWIEIDAEGLPVRSSARYALADGTVIQTVRTDRGSQIAALIGGTAAGPDSEQSCATSSASGLDLLIREIPPVMSDAELTGLGLHRGDPPTELQGTEDNFGVSLWPEAEAEPDDSLFASELAAWTRLDSDSAFTKRTVIMVDELNGRYLGHEIVVTDADGRVVSLDRMEFGPVHVYSVDRVPPAVFGPQPLEEAC